MARQQLITVKDFFSKLASRGVQLVVKNQSINVVWGNFEIAEVRRKGKKFELCTKLKWLKSKELMLKWQKQGWVDSSGSLNTGFCATILDILDYLEALEQEGKLRPQDLLASLLYKGKEP